MSTKVLHTHKKGVSTLTLNRPDVHNAFDAETISVLSYLLNDIQKDTRVKCIVLEAAGKSFSAGADLKWMEDMAQYSRDENYSDAMKLANLMQLLYQCPHPIIAKVQGATYGGGVGLVACCDIVVACESARFSLSEVKLGLIPSVVSPYVVACIGQHQARRYFLTGEQFDAHTAKNIGLVHEVTKDDELNPSVAEFTDMLIANGPKAMQEAKSLIRKVYQHPIDVALRIDTAQLIADVRVTEEAQEGMRAFLEKRPPIWP